MLSLWAMTVRLALLLLLALVGCRTSARAPDWQQLQAEVGALNFYDFSKPGDLESVWETAYRDALPRIARHLGYRTEPQPLWQGCLQVIYESPTQAVTSDPKGKLQAALKARGFKQDLQTAPLAPFDPLEAMLMRLGAAAEFWVSPRGDPVSLLIMEPLGREVTYLCLIAWPDGRG